MLRERISLCQSVCVKCCFLRRTIRIRRRLLRLEHLQIAYIVDVEFRLEHDDDAFPVHAHGEDGCPECHLTYGRVPLVLVSACLARVACPTNLGVLYAQHAWRQREGYQRRGEEHLEAGDISLARLGLLVKRVGGVYAVAIGRACAIRLVYIGRVADRAHTDA